MSVTSLHPLYVDRAPDWEQMIHTFSGQRTVKAERFKYLPATGGMEIDGLGVSQKGTKSYNAYLMRSLFPDFVKSAIETHLGIMHRESAQIELPEKLEPMRENASAQGESLDALLRRVNFNQLKTGRFGMLLEAPTGRGPTALPFIATYSATAVTNWDDGRKEQGEQKWELVVLSESELERDLLDGFAWELQDKHRVLRLGLDPDTLDIVYQVAVTRDGNDPIEEQFITPSIGGIPLNSIPFVVVNAMDILPNPDAPPFLGLSDLALTVYRSQADYRHTLFMQGQETLVVIGAEEGEDGNQSRVGAGARMDLPMDADAKYVGVQGEGTGEQRQAIDADTQQALQQGSRILDSGGQDRQSGEALRVRVQAKTPTLNSIVTAGAQGLEAMLKFAAVWVDADPEEVSVKPNKDFVEDTLIGRDLVEIMTAKHLGAPLSEKSVHALMRRKDLTRMDFEDEKDLIEDEDPAPIPPSAAQRGGVSVVADTDEPGGIRSRTSGADD